MPEEEKQETPNPAIPEAKRPAGEGKHPPEAETKSAARQRRKREAQARKEAAAPEPPAPRRETLCIKAGRASGSCVKLLYEARSKAASCLGRVVEPLKVMAQRMELRSMERKRVRLLCELGEEVSARPEEALAPILGQGRIGELIEKIRKTEEAISQAGLPKSGE